MLCPQFSRMLRLLTLATLVFAVPAVSAQSSWKVYDLRDLLGLIPPPRPADVPSPEPRVGMGIYGEPPESPAPKGAPHSVDQLMDRLCNALAVNCTPLLAGVYGVEADDAEHTQVLQMLEEIRALYGERYEVEIVYFMVDAEQAPAIGDPATPAGPLHRCRLVVTRRTPTPLTTVTVQSYISDLQPVVAQNAVAYDPLTERAADGLEASILVGAGKDEGNATSIQVIGKLRRVSMGKMSGPVLSGDPSGLQIELPAVSVRSIQSHLRVEYGKLTVLSVLDGFDAGQSFVIAASARRLDD